MRDNKYDIFNSNLQIIFRCYPCYVKRKINYSLEVKAENWFKDWFYVRFYISELWFILVPRCYRGLQMKNLRFDEECMKVLF